MELSEKYKQNFYFIFILLQASNVRFFFKLKDVTFCGCYPNSPR